MNKAMHEQMAGKPGFIAALDQSGGSTPGALKLYGIPETDYNGDGEMFRLVHEMRVRIITAPPFRGDKVIAAILFERTMDGMAGNKPVPDFLWNDRGVVPFLKIDAGLEPESGGVSLMKPMPKLDSLLERAVKHGIFGTKMRSVISRATQQGIEAVVAQQFAIAEKIAGFDLMPIIEPEISIRITDKQAAEALLLTAIKSQLDALPADRQVMLKLTLPDVTDLYLPLIDHPRVLRVVALSGGYSRAEACNRLAMNHGMIASFSRALVQDLRFPMSGPDFNAGLQASIDEIFKASTTKA